jgi:RNA polymerase sigma-70 factor (sigma-E family)
MAGRSHGLSTVQPVSSSIDYAELYREHWRPLLRLAQGLVDDVATAEDVVQEAFAALYRKQDSLAQPAAAVGYLRTCVVNGARSTLRRRRTVRVHLTSIRDDDYAPGADQPALLSEEHHAVRATLNSLPRRQREVLSLRLLAELSDDEIARATGMSPANVRSSASRGLAALRLAIGAKA